MRVMNEETFGPVIAISRVKDEDEAVKMANDSTLNGLKTPRCGRRISRGGIHSRPDSKPGLF